MQHVVEEMVAFQQAGGGPVGAAPAFPDPTRQLLRRRLIQEEVEELEAAHRDQDLVAVADALADITYVVVGMAVEYGIPLAEVWAEVHRSNMAKFPGGQATYREDGKVVKPAGWQPPDVVGVLRKHGFPG